MKRAFAVMLVGLVGVVGGCETPAKPIAKPIAKPMTATMGNQGGAQSGTYGGTQPGTYGGAQPGGVQQSGFTGYPSGQPGMNGTMPAGGVAPSVLPGGGYPGMGNVRTPN